MKSFEDHSMLFFILGRSKGDIVFAELSRLYYSIKDQRIEKFYDSSNKLEKYVPYNIVVKNPFIAVEFDKYIKKILVLEKKIEEQLLKVVSKDKTDKEYKILLEKYENNIKAYRDLVLKYPSLNDLKDDLVKNQKQR